MSSWDDKLGMHIFRRDEYIIRLECQRDCPEVLTVGNNLGEYTTPRLCNCSSEEFDNPKHNWKSARLAAYRWAVEMGWLTYEQWHSDPCDLTIICPTCREKESKLEVADASKD